MPLTLPGLGRPTAGLQLDPRTKVLVVLVVSWILLSPSGTETSIGAGMRWFLIALPCILFMASGLVVAGLRYVVSYAIMAGVPQLVWRFAQSGNWDHGVPGILLAIVQPQRPIYLVEPVGKKVAFLRQSVLTLGLKNATVLAGKIEDLESLLRADPLPRKGRDGAVSTPADSGADPSAEEPASRTMPRPAEEAVDHPALRSLISPPHFICRAFTALGRFAALCEPYMSRDSLLFAMKSLRLSEEQQALPESIMLQAVEPLPTINLSVQRNLAILSLAGNTLTPDAAQPAAATPPTPPGSGTAASALTQTTSPTASHSPATGTPSSSLPPSAQPNRRRPQ